MVDWTNVYLQNSNQMPFMNNLNNNMNFNNPMDQIQFMAVGGGQNNNHMMEDDNFNAMNQMRSLNQNQNYKINLCFSTLKGTKINMFFDCNETIEGVITKFIKRVNLTHLIGNLQNKLKFLLAAESINYGDKRKLKDALFTGCTMVNVVVHDTQNLIGA